MLPTIHHERTQVDDSYPCCEYPAVLVLLPSGRYAILKAFSVRHPSIPRDVVDRTMVRAPSLEKIGAIHIVIVTGQSVVTGQSRHVTSVVTGHFRHAGQS